MRSVDTATSRANPPDLARSFSSRHMFGLAFGAILGAGWIVGVGQWLAQAGPYGAVAGMTSGAVVIALVALCYAEAGSMFPSSGGEVDYAERFFGRAAGYCTGWLLALTYIGAAAFEAISIGWLYEELSPAPHTRYLYSLFNTGITLTEVVIGVMAVLVAGIVNYRGGRSMGRIQELLTYLLCGSALIFVAAGCVEGNLSYLSPRFVKSASGSVLPGISAVLITAPFWFSGFGVVSYSLGEMGSRVSFNRIASVMVAAVLGALSFYVATLLATALTLPRERLLNLDLPASAAFRAAFGSVWITRIVLLTGIVALLMALNALVFASSRVIFQLSRSRLLLPSCGNVHPRFGSPHRAVMLCSLLAVIAVFFGRGATGSLVNICAVCISCVYLLICAGVTRFRWSKRDGTGRFGIPGRLLIPMVATILTAGMIAVSVLTVLTTPEQLTFQLSVLILWMAAGLGLWLCSGADRAGSGF